MIATSLLTLVRGRQAHLNQLLEGLAEQTFGDFELVIACMQPGPPSLPSTRFPVRLVDVPGDPMPLARARNAAARAARGPTLIFLDVDCIASPSSVQSYTHHLQVHDHCAMGEVRYLPPPELSCQASAFDELRERAVKHPARPEPPSTGWRLEPEARSLWGLSFAMRRDTYLGLGGMDERFVGYGGEETDLAETLAGAGVPLAWIAGALALHQHHPFCTPPLDKFDDIVRNATLFRRKRGSWCLEYWLGKFQDLGLLQFAPEAEELVVHRRPTPAEITGARCEDLPYA